MVPTIISYHNQIISLFVYVSSDISCVCVASDTVNHNKVKLKDTFFLVVLRRIYTQLR